MAEAFRTDISFLVAAPLATDLPPRSGPIPEVLQRLDVDSDHGLLREACRDAVWGVRAKFAIATGDELQLCTVGGAYAPVSVAHRRLKLAAPFRRSPAPNHRRIEDHSLFRPR